MPRNPDVPSVLAHHGIDPAADEATLLAALEARGWTVRAEELAAPSGTTGRSPRFRALALRERLGGAADAAGHGVTEHRQASGRTAAEAFGRMLAAVLERGGDGSGAGDGAR